MLITRVKYFVKKIFFRPLNNYLVKKDMEYIKGLKRAYEGKRCFIIGNGPSLKLEDLDLIKKEYCFGSHRIYTVFDKTEWRPTFYCAQDAKLINKSSKEINKIKVAYKFISIFPDNVYKKIKNAHFIKMSSCDIYPQLPLFSEEISRCIYEGYTVTYMCIQLAAYLGFKEIYLLGIDHSYSKDIRPDGTIINYDVKDHFDENDELTNIPQTYKSTLAYKAAYIYAQKQDIEIVNCTRGGKLDVFKRMNLEDVL